jgi:hypothetical protein
MRKLVLYTSLGCHLCEQAEALIEPLLPRFELSLEKVEIADSEDLMAHYGMRIPVVRLESAQQELAWPFVASDFARYVDAVS